MFMMKSINLSKNLLTLIDIDKKIEIIDKNIFSKIIKNLSKSQKSKNLIKIFKSQIVDSNIKALEFLNFNTRKTFI